LKKLDNLIIIIIRSHQSNEVCYLILVSDKNQKEEWTPILKNSNVIYRDLRLYLPIEHKISA